MQKSDSWLPSPLQSPLPYVDGRWSRSTPSLPTLDPLSPSLGQTSRHVTPTRVRPFVSTPWSRSTTIISASSSNHSIPSTLTHDNDTHTPLQPQTLDRHTSPSTRPRRQHQRSQVFRSLDSLLTLGPPLEALHSVTSAPE
ncbi:uncharacterized protein PAN0_033c6258 [Moesziomyces antarcticus]|uniref:Uncharacterized protein n=1 Tax=Pseudozyma antarctica TaxID=84753 RepID=A0A081CMY2_PSEA2|nr:uncharacterized protein PAN0_033c6258 [Moesziomyces antarcticus]GAK68028.1 hypothetical protein PAN0_033c6258 [Moesziomyces antarcticus]